MERVKKAMVKTIDEMKDMIIEAMSVAYADGYEDGFISAMESVAAIIDAETKEDDERRPS